MQAKAIIYLHSVDPLQVSWIIFDEEGRTAQFISYGELSTLAAELHDHIITVIVPAEDVLLTQAALPKLNQQKLLQALPLSLIHI